MSKKRIQTLPGFRDHFPEDCAVRNYVFDAWRSVCARYGFVEYEGPILEYTDLYRKKSGEGLVGELFQFEDKGERDVSMRPELTPTLARMISAKAREFKKPMKWFSIGPFFRYEKQQKGRLREFYQFNADIVGEKSVHADAELIALSIDIMRELGFGPEHFGVRVSDRNAWLEFLEKKGVDAEKADAFLGIIDKLEREKPEALCEKLKPFNLTIDEINDFINNAGESSETFKQLQENLTARGMGEYLTLDLSIVRGLAYYTGTVFELFDASRGMRAIAGGGRYDQLFSTISDGKTDLPAIGFGMGDVVITDLIKETSVSASKLTDHLSKAVALDAFVVIASETYRNEAIGTAQRLRQAGFRVDYPLDAAKVGKQFKTAEQFQARAAIVIGEEFPQVNVKDLETREERTVDAGQVPGTVAELLQRPGGGPLIA